MKPLFLKIESSNVYTIREQLVSHVYSRYYYHPQIEIVYFEKSDGMCIIGDKVHIIKEGDIFMLGGNLPHLFRNDEKYADKKLKVRIIATAFFTRFWRQGFFGSSRPEKSETAVEKSRKGHFC